MKKSELQKAKEKYENLQKKVDEQKEKYEGKFFKFNNSRQSEPDKIWFVYFFCKKVIDDNKYIVDEWENEPNSQEIIISLGKEEWGSSFETEITKEEYFRAIDKLCEDLKNSTLNYQRDDGMRGIPLDVPIS